MTAIDRMGTVRISSLLWAGPFAFIGMAVLTLFRPLSPFDAPRQFRVVVDAAGTPVKIATPFRGTAMIWAAFVDEYLLSTQAPDTVQLSAHQDRVSFERFSTMSWVYPELLRREHIWDEPLSFRARGNHAEIETLFSYAPGAFLGTNLGSVDLLRSIGMPALYVNRNEKNWDQVLYSRARVESALVGHPERGAALIDAYQRAYAELARELQPERLTRRPRVLIMGSSTLNRSWLYIKSEKNSYQIYLPPAGVENASIGYTGERPDAERILAMDPEYIFLVGRRDSPNPAQGPAEFMRDPRWSGLTAVRARRVYRMPGLGPGGLAGLQLQPVWVRLMAEITHPDRLRPRIRQLLRDSFMNQFGYRIDDDRIDQLLHIDENRDSSGYERFARTYVPNPAGTQQND